MKDRPTLDEPVANAPETLASLARELGDRLPAYGALIEGTYRVKDVIGRGGMGVVLLAQDEQLQREVAIKVIASKSALRSEAQERFLREARAMAGVQHQNVVRIYAYGRWSGVPYFVMEYVPGSNVADWLDVWDEEGSPPPSLDEVLGIFDQVARGVEAIHAADIVHADLKPGNVLIGPAFQVAVTDFGLVRDLGKRDSDDLIVGTPSYIAPEVVYSDTPVFDRRADVFSLGVMAYEMLTGELPFPIESIPELFDVHLRRIPPVPLSEVRGDLPEALDEVFARALSRDVGERYATASELRRALLAARESVSTDAGHMRFVVADDDPHFRELIAESLRFAYPGSRVECFEEGSSALRALDAYGADLAVIDLDMPGLNGIELTASIRANASNRKLPIMIVTAHGGATDWRLLQSLGADGFLVKPLDPYALVAMARRVLSGSLPPPRRR